MPLVPFSGPTSVARLLHPRRQAKLALIEAALASLGKRLEVQLVDAA
jgi:hypothetical protein